MGVEQFFAYAVERYKIKLQRQLQPQGPWTVDPIFQQYRFCNVFREDDKTTQWFKKNVRDPHWGQGCVIPATIIFRWFNRIETGERLLEHGLLTKWSSRKAMVALKDLSPMVTGAYVIKTPAKMTKLEGLCWCIENVWVQRHQLVEAIDWVETLEAAHVELMQFPYLGAFMAYEIVTDLRHTAFLESATDIDLWASAGPGAARGLGRILTGDTKQFNYNLPSNQTEMHTEMLRLLALSRDHRHWPPRWPRWEMRDVEHTLCEFDKYERVRLGEGRPKRRFTPCTS